MGRHWSKLTRWMLVATCLIRPGCRIMMGHVMHHSCFLSIDCEPFSETFDRFLLHCRYWVLYYFKNNPFLLLWGYKILQTKTSLAPWLNLQQVVNYPSSFDAGLNHYRHAFIKAFIGGCTLSKVLPSLQTYFPCSWLVGWWLLQTLLTISCNPWWCPSQVSAIRRCSKLSSLWIENSSLQTRRWYRCLSYDPANGGGGFDTSRFSWNTSFWHRSVLS